MKERLAENIFFFGLFGFISYLLWQIIAPFFTALALAVVISVVCYPVYLHIVRFMPRKNTSLASIFSVILIASIIFAPLLILGYLLFLQIVSFYELLSSTSVAGFHDPAAFLEALITKVIPGVSIDIAEYMRQVAEWMVAHIGGIFAGTASTLLLLFIMFIAIFYLLRDGPGLVRTLLRLSPLPDTQDAYVLQKVSAAIRSVVLGTLAVAFIQGILTSIGFALFGMPQPVLWGSVAAIGALIPGVGTSLVFIGAIAYLLSSQAYGIALGLGIWGVFAVGLIDNLLGPYLMGRGATLHPFLVLLSVLGGVVVFGPIGFLLGPVLLSFFTVLLELYVSHISSSPTPKKHAR